MEALVATVIFGSGVGWSEDVGTSVLPYIIIRDIEKAFCHVLHKNTLP